VGWKDALYLLDLLARLEMTLHLPAESPEPANAVEGFLSSIQQLAGVDFSADPRETHEPIE
jgi:hypothetical protein